MRRARKIVTKQTPGESPAFSSVRAAVSGVLLALLVVATFALNASGEQKYALSIVFGALFGIVLQRSRFCFFCMFRDWFDEGDARGLYGLLIALAAGAVGYTIVYGAWLPDAFVGRLPPDAFIGPVGIALVLAGLVFGAGMAISGSCISAHLYRLGEGSPTAPFALVGTLAGFVLGFATWNPIYLTLIQGAPIVWLPGWLGYTGALGLALAALFAIGLALRATSRALPRPAPPADLLTSVVIQRWPAWAGGLAVAALGTAAYLRVAPLGVTAEIGNRARDLASSWLPDRLEGLDTLRGCITVAKSLAFSPNGAFVGALIIASFAAALTAAQFKPARPTADQAVRGLVGGVLLGWGATIGLGCTIGTLLSGVMAGALSGWVFGAAVFVAVAGTLRAGRRLGVLA